ncbi:hypothetical protein [Aquimarina megaterium]|uniref:hypothetical protein n=1 Tax=Aquimarina megaterium TaxID=1443666 RepID=UPI00046FB46B|nr:hypothetical protein [Aquimarina megaterium]
MDILHIIFDAIDEINLSLEDVQMDKNEDTVIFGKESVLDSMDLVHFISLIEEKIEDESGNYISIADENAMSLEVSPFKTVKTLKEYINQLL